MWCLKDAVQEQHQHCVEKSALNKELLEIVYVGCFMCVPLFVRSIQYIAHTHIHSVENRLFLSVRSMISALLPW